MDRRAQAAQTSLFREMIVDSFAGGGGASTGIELATGRPVDIAINHDPAAILMHRTNHPYTVHHQESVWDVDPRRVCAGRPVGLLWASPDCKHFSRAKGGKPVEKGIRGLAWVVLRWAGTVRPRVIMLENVPEFVTWGPVRRGRPVPAKSGQTFRRFITQLRALGYTVDFRELIAADYGAPTTRRRFFLIARCDGRAIVWPEPTHASADSSAVLSGQKRPYESAAAVIDWDIPCPSIFASRDEIRAQYGLSAQRPLRPNTLRRIARGIDRFVIRSASPFIVGVGGRAGDCPPRNITEPHRTCTTKADAAVCNPIFTPLTWNNTGESAGLPADSPVPTVRASASVVLTMPTLIQYHTEQSERVRGQDIQSPLMTVDAANRFGLAAGLVKYYGADAHGQSVQDPLHTITAKDREGMYLAHMKELYGNGEGRSAAAPLSTVTDSGAHHAAVVSRIEESSTAADLGHWPKIRDLLNRYCGYELGPGDVMLFQIAGADYFLSDIGLRMLTPRELYRAQGFPEDYVIERDYTGKAYPKKEQVARCGNAVPPPFAAALVRANLPEWCGEPVLKSMEDFGKAAAL